MCLLFSACSSKTKQYTFKQKVASMNDLVKQSIETTAIIWKEIVAELRKPVLAIAKGDLKIKGGIGNFNEFMKLFKED